VVGGEAFAGTETARLAELARSVGVGAQVRFLGNRLQTELPHLLATADVLVDTPWFEPLGKSPVEAMACGTPPVVSDVGGASHTIVDGATGFLVRPRDPLGLAARLEQLHGNPALARAMGRAGVARARTTFAWDHIAELLGVAYHRALDRALSDATRSWVLASPETANIFPVPLPGMGPIQELDEGFVRRRPFSRLGRADTRINSPIKSAARAN
jgi:D-inositol-3-phosphate glycosyltransferase